MQVTDAELVDALARRRLGLPPPRFAVHEARIISYNGSSHPTRLYDQFGGNADESAGCVYLFSDQIHAGDNWKVASGNEPVLDLDAGGGEVGSKVTFAFHESRWRIGNTRWIMDEFDFDAVHKYGKCISWRLYDLPLYRLRRLDGSEGPPRQQEARQVGGFRRMRVLGN